MDFMEVITARRSIRRYQKKAIPEEVVTGILNCARLAPTARNVQPWLIGATAEKSLLKELADTTDHGKHIADCAICFSVFCKKGEKYYLEDGCAATMNILHACQAKGLGACWIAGEKKAYGEKIRQTLNVPTDYTLIALIPAGYPDEKPAEKEKKPLKEVTFRDRM